MATLWTASSNHTKGQLRWAVQAKRAYPTLSRPYRFAPFLGRESPPILPEATHHALRRHSICCPTNHRLKTPWWRKQILVRVTPWRSSPGGGRAVCRPRFLKLVQGRFVFGRGFCGFFDHNMRRRLLVRLVNGWERHEHLLLRDEHCQRGSGCSAVS